MKLSDNELISELKTLLKSLEKTMDIKKEFHDNFEAVLISLYKTNSKLEELDNKALTNFSVFYGGEEVKLSRAEMSVLGEIQLHELDERRKNEESNKPMVYISKKELLERLVKINHTNGHYLLNKMSIEGSKKKKEKDKPGMGLIEEIKPKSGENARALKVKLTVKGQSVFNDIYTAYTNSNLFNFQKKIDAGYNMPPSKAISAEQRRKLELTYNLLNSLELFYKELINIEELDKKTNCF